SRRAGLRPPGRTPCGRRPRTGPLPRRPWRRIASGIRRWETVPLSPSSSPGGLLSLSPGSLERRKRLLETAAGFVAGCHPACADRDPEPLTHVRGAEKGKRQYPDPGLVEQVAQAVVGRADDLPRRRAPTDQADAHGQVDARLGRYRVDVEAARFHGQEAAVD